MSEAGGVDVVHVKVVRMPVMVVVVMVAIVTVVAAIGVPAPVFAHKTQSGERSRQEGIDREIERLEDELGGLGAEEHDLAHRLEDARRRRLEVDAQLQSLAGEIAAVEGDLAAATDRLTVADAKVDRVAAQLEVARWRFQGARRDVRDRAVTAYINNPGGEIADAVFEARDLREFGARTAYARAVVQTHVRTVDRLRAARDDAAEARRDHEAARQSAVDARDTISVQRLELEERHHAHRQLRDTAVAQESQEEALLEEVRNHRAGHESRLAALRQESDSITSFLRSIQAGQSVTISGSGQLFVPITGARLTSSFGPRVHPLFGTERMHTGVDFAAPSGTPVRAAGAGRVVHAGPRGGYGNAVVIDHGGSLATLYAHLSFVAVAAGEDVKAGEVIGAVGSTGFSTGPHLHFEVRVAGNPVDPLPYL